MIIIKITNKEIALSPKKHKMYLLKVKLTELGFTQFDGNFNHRRSKKSAHFIFTLYPTVQDLIMKKIPWDFKFNWQRDKEILYRKFKI